LTKGVREVLIKADETADYADKKDGADDRNTICGKKNRYQGNHRLH
jgi:hypothetical protein